MWGDKVAEKRNLFQTIFGKKTDNGTNNYTNYRLLSSYQSNFIPFSGNAWDINTVRAAIDSFARRAAKVKPRHILRRDGKLVDVSDEYNRILQYQPNPFTTAYKFYYRLAANYKQYNNAFAFPVWDDKGKLSALYNINAQSIELLEYMGEMYVRFKFATGRSYTYPYSEIIHIGSQFCDNDIFGSDGTPILAVLKTANTFNQSMSKFAELVAIIRGILKVQDAVKGEDLKQRREQFIQDNLTLENNGAGIVVTDRKYEYEPITDKTTPIPSAQLAYIKGEIYDFYGTNEKIVQNKESPEEAEAYYEGELEPFFTQLSQALTNCFFTARELGYGNEIAAEGNKLQYARLSDKLAAIKYLSEIGGVSLDQALATLGFPTIGGEEGARRTQTLNVVNAEKADEYQGVGGDGSNDDKPETDGKEGDNAV